MRGFRPGKGGVRSGWRGLTGGPRLPLLVLGVVLLLLGAILPWINLPLYASRRAWNLPVFVTGLGHVAKFNYGVLTVACALLIVAATIAARGRPSAGAAIFAAAAAALPVFLVVQTVLSDQPLFLELQRARREYGVLGHMYGYPNLAVTPQNFLFLPLQGPWGDTIADLRLGVFATLLGGLIVVGACGGALVRAATTHRRPFLAGIGAAIAILIATTGRGAFADLLVSTAAAPAAAGDYGGASQLLDLAVRVNPDITVGSAYQFALGDVIRWRGNPRTPLALLADSRVQAGARRPDRQLDDLRLAAAGAPEDSVITDELLRVARGAAMTARNPDLLVPYVDQPWGDLPTARYALGQIYYDRADYPAALLEFRRFLAITPSNPDAQSAGYTRIALAEGHLGRLDDARHHILQAVALDKRYVNSIARSLAAGLFAPAANL